MANNFQISLVGSLNSSKTIENINEALDKIVSSNKLKPLNLSIKDIKLSDNALKSLNNLKITPTIAGFNISEQAVQRDIAKIGQNMGNTLSSSFAEGTNSKELNQKLKAELESIAKDLRKNKLSGLGNFFNISAEDGDEVAAKLKKLTQVYNNAVTELSKAIVPMNMMDEGSQEFKKATDTFAQSLHIMGAAGAEIDKIVQQYGKLKDAYGDNSIFSDFLKEYRGRTFYIPSPSDLLPEFGGLKGLNQAFVGQKIRFSNDKEKGSYDYNELAEELTRIAGIDTSNILNDMDLLNTAISHFIQSAKNVRELTPLSKIYGDDTESFSATTENFSEIIGYVDKATATTKQYKEQIRQAAEQAIQGTATFVVEEEKKQAAAEKTTQAFIEQQKAVGNQSSAFESFSGFTGTIEEAEIRLRALADEEKEVVTIAKSVDENGRLKGFTASIKRATGEVEKLRFGLSETEGVFDFLGGATNDSVSQNIRKYQKALDDLQKKYLSTDFDFTPLKNAIEEYRRSGTELNKLQAEYDRTTRAVNEYYNALKSKDKSLDPIQQAINEMRTMSGVFDSLQTKINGLKNNGEFNATLLSLRQEYERLNAVIKASGGQKLPFNKEWVNAYSNLSANIKDLEKNVKNSQVKINEFANVKLSNSIDDWLRKNTKAAKDYGQQLEEIKRQTEGADAITLKRLRQEFDNVKKAAADAGKLGKSFVQTLQEGATKFSEWVFASGLVMQSIHALKQMFVEVKNIDTAMTELAKVSEATNKELQKSLSVSIETAKTYGATVDGIIQATADWSRLGYNLPEAQQLAEIATLYKNVGDGIDIGEANTSLISTLKGYQLQTEDALSVIDAFNEVA